MKDSLVPNEKCIDYIKSKTDQQTVLLQLAEECTEVAQMALKLARIYEGKNPTPATASDVSNRLIEEIADTFAVLDCLDGLDYTKIGEIETFKLNRWCVRLAKRNKL